MSGAVSTIHVELGARGYDVMVGPGLLARSGALIQPLLTRPRCAVVTDETVAALHGDALQAGLSKVGVAAETILVPPGERSKCWAEAERVAEALLSAKIERNDIVIAFGGGVIGDLAGFAAAILRRGVRFVQLPSTLLAQVDSSVGGKTGINSRQGKKPDRRLSSTESCSRGYRPFWIR